MLSHTWVVCRSIHHRYITCHEDLPSESLKGCTILESRVPRAIGGTTKVVLRGIGGVARRQIWRLKLDNGSPPGFLVQISTPNRKARGKAGRGGGPESSRPRCYDFPQKRSEHCSIAY